MNPDFLLNIPAVMQNYTLHEKIEIRSQEHELWWKMNILASISEYRMISNEMEIFHLFQSNSWFETNPQNSVSFI